MEPKAPESQAVTPDKAQNNPAPVAELPKPNPTLPEEFGGSGKAEPTRYGDWEVNGRCTDF